jgi:hypothetical protein
MLRSPLRRGVALRAAPRRNSFEQLDLTSISGIIVENRIDVTDQRMLFLRS